MKNRLIKRLQNLENEYQKGQERLQQLESEVTNVRSSMLRISGAIQVLREELEAEERETEDVSAVPESTVFEHDIKENGLSNH